MQALFAPNQLELKYGGKAPNVETNFWPPIMPDIDVGCDPEKILSEDKYHEYLSERPSLNRRPGFVSAVIKEKEEEKQ